MSMRSSIPLNMNNERERLDLEASVIVLGIVLGICLMAAIGRFAGFI